MSTTTLVEVGFRCVSGKRVDVVAALGTLAQGKLELSSNGGRTEQEGKARIPAAAADEATTLLRGALEEAASAAGTTCEITILRTRLVTGAR